MQRNEGKARLVGVLALSAVLMGVAGTQAADVYWDGDGFPNTSFLLPVNWNPDGVPTNGSSYYMSEGGTVTLVAGNVGTAGNIIVEGSTVFNMTGGTLNLTTAGDSVRSTIGNTGTGTFNQSGGTVACGHLLAIGTVISPGVYNLSGGALNITSGGKSLQGSEVGASVSLSLGKNNYEGTLNITGGSLTTRYGVEIAPKGVFYVGGSAPSKIEIGSIGDGDGRLDLNAGTLKFGIDAGGVTKILIDEVDGVAGTGGDGIASLDGASKLDVSFLGGHLETNAWVVLEAEGGIVDNGLELAASVASGWTFGVTTNPVAGSDVLWVSYGGAAYVPPSPPDVTTNLYVEVPVTLPAWNLFDSYNDGALTSSNSAGFVANVGNSTASGAYMVEYQRFSALDLTQIGQKIEAEFNIQMNSAPDVGDTTFRWAFFDTVLNCQIAAGMVDLGAVSGTAMRMRLGKRISYSSPTTFVEGDYAYLTYVTNAVASDTFGGTGLVLNNLNFFRTSLERTGTNEVTAVCYWSDSTGANTLTYAIDETNGALTLPTGGKYKTFNGFGFQIFDDTPFSGTGSYQLSNFKLSYTSRLSEGFSYSVSQVAVNLVSGDVTLTLSEPLVGATYVVQATDDLVFSPMQEIGSYVANDPGTITIPAADLAGLSSENLFFDVGLSVAVVVE